MYFFVVETTYYGPRPTMDKLGVDEKHKSVFELEDEREPYRSQLTLFRGRLSPESFWKNAWKPVPLIAFPAVLFSTIVYGSYFVRKTFQTACEAYTNLHPSLLDLAAHYLCSLRQHLLGATVYAEPGTSRSYQSASASRRTHRLTTLRLDSRCPRQIHGSPQQRGFRTRIPPDSHDSRCHLRHSRLPRLRNECFSWLSHRLALGLHVHSLAFCTVCLNSQSDLCH